MILGLHYNYCHNPSATLAKNGEIIAFAEEERFSRNKHAFNEFPVNAAQFCLEKAGVSIEKVDAIAIAWDVEKYPDYIKEFNTAFEKQYGPLSGFSQNWLWNNNRFDKNALLRLLYQAFPDIQNVKGPDVFFIPHHVAHAASAFYLSGFNEATIITADGKGEEDAIHIYRADQTGIESLKQWNIPQSIGFFYTKFTMHFGFSAQDGEGKLMGLAPYGHDSTEMDNKLDLVCPLTNDEHIFKLNPDYFFRENVIASFSKEWIDLFGKPLKASRFKEYFQEEKDLAYAVQKRLETITLRIIKQGIQLTGIKQVCCAGGVFMNCKANGVIARMIGGENYFVPPIASDNGVSLGAAMTAYAKKVQIHPKRINSVYWGPSFTDDEIQSALDKSGLPYQRSSNIAMDAAQYLEKKKVVGWFQDKMEAGARALGARSILGNPLVPEVREIINNKVKFREPWRPFCPSVIAEDAEQYFETNGVEMPFMIIACQVKPEYRTLLPSVVHCDDSVRIQTVTKDSNPLFYSLLLHMKQNTGIGIVLNTSFNRAGEPIVCTPEEAITCFQATGMDALAIGNFFVIKERGHNENKI